MKRLPARICLAAAVATTLIAHGVAAAPRRPKEGPQRFADPGAVVAAEIAFARLAEQKGQWTAFRETAAEDAVMFVPQPVSARDWLKRQKNPARSVTWQPHQVWLSCDGSMAVTYGASQSPDGGAGYFTTVWKRQKDGGYKWVMDQGDRLGAPLTAPEMIGAGVAKCERRPVPVEAAVPTGAREGASADGTLRWKVDVDARCARTVTVSLYRGAGKPMDVVLDKRVEAPQASASGTPAVCGAI